MIEVAAGDANVWNRTQYLANNGAALERLVAGGVTVREFPESVWQAFGKAAQETLEESVDDPLYKKVYDSMRASMKKTSAWLGVAENAYTAQRNKIWG